MSRFVYSLAESALQISTILTVTQCPNTHANTSAMMAQLPGLSTVIAVQAKRYDGSGPNWHNEYVRTL